MAISFHLIGTRGVGGGSTVITGAGTSVGGSGNHGFLVVSFDPGVNPPATVTDSKLNVLALVGTTVSDASHGKLAAYLKENWNGGASHDSGTVTFSGTAYAVAHLVEVRGAATSGSLEKDVNGSAASMPVSVASGVLLQAAEAILAIAACNVYSTNGDYSSTNLTVISSEPDVGSYWTSGVGGVVVASTASVTYDMRRANPATTGGGVIRLFSFKEATGGGPEEPHPADVWPWFNDAPRAALGPEWDSGPVGPNAAAAPVDVVLQDDTYLFPAMGAGPEQLQIDDYANDLPAITTSDASGRIGSRVDATSKKGGAATGGARAGARAAATATPGHAATSAARGAGTAVSGAAKGGSAAAAARTGATGAGAGRHEATATTEAARAGLRAAAGGATPPPTSDTTSRAGARNSTTSTPARGATATARGGPAASASEGTGRPAGAAARTGARAAASANTGGVFTSEARSGLRASVATTANRGAQAGTAGATRAAASASHKAGAATVATAAGGAAAGAFKAVPGGAAASTGGRTAGVAGKGRPATSAARGGARAAATAVLGVPPAAATIGARPGGSGGWPAKGNETRPRQQSGLRQNPRNTMRRNR